LVPKVLKGQTVMLVHKVLKDHKGCRVIRESKAMLDLRVHRDLLDHRDLLVPVVVTI
jgi:hypothetical protein